MLNYQPKLRQDSRLAHISAHLHVASRSAMLLLIESIGTPGCVSSPHWGCKNLRGWPLGGFKRATWTGINCISTSVPLDTSVKYCVFTDLPTFPVNFASPNSTKRSRLYGNSTALQPVFSARSTLFPVARSFPPAKIRSSCPRLRANFSQQFGCWMVNCSSEGSGVNILAGARVRQAACFAVPGCLGYCCAFYRY